MEVTSALLFDRDMLRWISYSHLRDIRPIQKQDIYKILAFPWLQLKLPFTDGPAVTCFSPPFSLCLAGTAVVASRSSLSWRVCCLLAVAGGCPWPCPPGSDHCRRRGDVLFPVVCRKTATCGFNAVYISWLNQTGLWLLVVLLLVAVWQWKCVVHVSPKELQQQMVNVQREHTHGTAFRSSQRPFVSRGEKIIERGPLTQWYAICPLPQHWRFKVFGFFFSYESWFSWLPRSL